MTEWCKLVENFNRLTCSYSSLIIFGSSCLWNHIMYFVWNLHDCQILRLRPLHVVEDEKERLCWQPLKEFNRIWPLWRQLRVVVGRRTRVPRQVRSQPFRVWWMRHVEVSRFEHLVLQLRFLRERNWSEGCYAEQWRNVRFSLWTSILRLWRVEQAWKMENECC